MTVFKKIILLFFLLSAAHSWCNTVLVATHVDYEQQLREHIGEGFFLETLTLDVAACMDVKQAEYLLAIKESSFISYNDLVRGVSLLMKKNKIASLQLCFEDGMAGKLLTIRVLGLWTLRSVKIQGIMTGKEFYRNRYVLEPGDIFDEKKHYHALDKIKQELTKDGYFDAALRVQVNRETVSMQVDVVVDIRLGKQFSIGLISVDAESVFDGDKSELLVKVKNFLVHHIPKGKYSLAVLNASTSALKKYLTKYGYSSVRVVLKESLDKKRNKVDLCFFLEDLERREFVFFGNHFFSGQQLQAIIAGFGPSVYVVPFSMIAEEFVQAYQAKGFLQVSVDVREDTASRSFIIINEGPRFLLSQVTIVSATSDASKDALRRACHRCMAKPLDSVSLDKALEEFCQWYIANGYWHMQITHKEYRVLPDGTCCCDITVQEGEQNFVADVTIATYDDFLHEGPVALYMQQLKQVQKMPLDSELIQAHKKWMLDYLHDQGYLQARVQYELRGERDALHIFWDVHPGTKLHFGKTVVQGSSQVPHDFIMRELQYQQGSVWSSKKLRASLVKLKDLGIFSAIHMHPDHEEVLLPDQSERTVVLKLQQDDPFEVRVRAGLGLQQVGKNFALGRGFTYKLGGTFIAKNPCNNADYFLFDADFARSHQSINVEYRMPWLFNMPIRSVVRGYANKYDQPGFVGSKDPLYSISRQGFIVSCTYVYRLYECIVNSGFEWMKTMVEPDNIDLALRVGRAIDFKPTLLDVKVPYWLIEPTVCIDGVDNRMCPTRGFLTVVALKGMIPLSSSYSSAYFMRFQAEQSFFYPLARRLIGGVRLRCGHIFHTDFSAVMPVERFYLGGANSVRSYDTDLCPPLGRFVDQGGVERIAPRGGKTMVNVNVELRYVLYKALELVLLQDVGLLTGSGRPDVIGGESHVVVGSGWGLRYNTPIGPLRFDIAWKWNTHKEYENSYAWFLRLGHAF